MRKFYARSYVGPRFRSFSQVFEVNYKVLRSGAWWHPRPLAPRFLGLDFGGVNTAGVFFAQERDAYHKPTGRLFAYREYRAGDRSAAEHCYHLMKTT
jgi:hypothetical protein